jgi:hypothetical protein
MSRLRRWNWTASRSSRTLSEFGSELGELRAQVAFLQGEMAELFL